MVPAALSAALRSGLGLWGAGTCGNKRGSAKYTRILSIKQASIVNRCRCEVFLFSFSDGVTNCVYHRQILVRYQPSLTELIVGPAQIALAKLAMWQLTPTVKSQQQAGTLV